MMDPRLAAAAVLVVLAAVLHGAYRARARQLARQHQEAMAALVEACRQQIVRLSADVSLLHAALVERQVLAHGELGRRRARLALVAAGDPGAPAAVDGAGGVPGAARGETAAAGAERAARVLVVEHGSSVH